MPTLPPPPLRAALRDLLERRAQEYLVGKSKYNVRIVRGVLMIRVQNEWHDFLKFAEDASRA